MDRDKLFIVNPDFRDPAYPNQRFYCWHCALMEGLLASFPDLSKTLDVERIDWPRPRTGLIDLLGPENQSVPVLVLASTVSADLPHKQHGSCRFIDDKDTILTALSLRHGLPAPHP